MTSMHALGWRYSLALECWFYYRVCRNWRQVISARTHQFPLDRFVLRNGSILAFGGAPPFQIFQEIWRRNVYCREYPRRWHTPRTVIDIGANIGFFSLYATHIWPQVQVFAYEPAPANFKWLQENIAASRAEGIHLSDCAVAGSIGPRTFYLGDEPGWHSFWKDEKKVSTLVETTTLDEIITRTGRDRIDFLKMDCEGAEYEILGGREDLLREHIRFIAMEYHASKSFRVQSLEEILARARFIYKKFPNQQWETGMLYAQNSTLD